MSSTRWWMTVAAIGCFGLASARTLRAEGTSNAEVLLTIKAPNPKDPKTKGNAPQIEATVIGAPNLTADKFTLLDKSAKSPVQMKALTRRPFNQGSDTLAVAIVMQGWEMWIGNDTYRSAKDPTRAAGMLTPLQAAIDKLDFKSVGPPGSVGTVIMYADKAVVRVPMGPLTNLTGAALGTQKDYAGTAGSELVKGVELALAELHKVEHPKKVLIVLTDGNDTNNETAKTALTQLKKHAQTDGVEAFAIVYKAADSSPVNLITQLTSKPVTVASAEGIAAPLQGILQRIGDRQYVTFAGYDKAAKLGLPWDGKAHDLVLKVDTEETEPVSLVLTPKWTPSGR